MAKKSLYFKNLDSIRFFAAMLVFSQHVFAIWFNQLDVNSSILNRLILLFTNGGIGVSIFFVLSGFLITYLIISEVEMNGKFNLGKFYIRRFLRIWPLYFAVVIFWFVIYSGVKYFAGITDPLGSDIWYHLTFLSNFDVLTIYQEGRGFNGMFQNINWSVSIEEQFYLFWPLVFLLPKKIWGYVILLLLLFSISFRLQYSNDILVNYLHTFAVLVDLVIGGLFAFAILKFKSIKKVFENSNTLSHALLLLITFLVLFFRLDFILGDFALSLGRVITSTLFAAIIASQALTTNSSVLNLSNFKMGNQWGKMTYGIYLLHPIALKMVDLICRKIKVDYQNDLISAAMVALVVLILTLALSYASYHYFEKKFLKYRTKYQIIKPN